MPVYDYKALDAGGRSLAGIVDADSPIAARQKLRQSGVFPVSVTESRSSGGKSTGIGLFSGFRVRTAEITFMTRQLATLVGAGFPLVTALDSLVAQAPSQRLKKTLAQVKDAVVEGGTFADALSRFPSVFSALYVNMVHAGESSGTLEVVLDRLADMMEKQLALKTRVRSAMAYPVFMGLVGAAVLLLLLAYILPNITIIFSDMDQVLPAPTRVLIRTSGLLRAYWPAIPAALIVGAALWRYLRKNGRTRYLTDRLLMKLPVAGPLMRKLAAARFARTLGSMLESGVSMIGALNIVRDIPGNMVFAEAIQTAAEAVGNGQGLGAALTVSGQFPDLVVQMIAVGEQSGDLEAMLAKIADAYESEVAASVMGATALLEPVMILIMGVLVGAIVVAICMPIFEMNRLVV